MVRGLRLWGMGKEGSAFLLWHCQGLELEVLPGPQDECVLDMGWG